MKKKSTPPPKTTTTPATETKTSEQPPKPRHPDADYTQKTHFGYVGAYA